MWQKTFFRIQRYCLQEGFIRFRIKQLIKD